MYGIQARPYVFIIAKQNLKIKAVSILWCPDNVLVYIFLQPIIKNTNWKLKVFLFRFSSTAYNLIWVKKKKKQCGVEVLGTQITVFFLNIK